MLLYRLKDSCDHIGKIWNKQKYIAQAKIYRRYLPGPRITAIAAIFTEVYLTLEYIEDM